MSVDVAALIALTIEKEIPLEKMISAIENAVTEAYLELEDAKPQGRAVLNRVDGEILIHVPQFDDEGIYTETITHMPEGFEQVIKSLDKPEIIILLKSFIETEIEKYKSNILSNFDDEIKNIYPDYFNFEDIKYQIRLMDYNNNNYIDININHKYKIVSPHLNHSLELFMVKYDDFFATVQTFHLPCVRSYYNGNNVYLTPSCVSAHLTYMNLDYKYFAGTRDPIDIINKYRMRGFGTWLNKEEKKLYIKYTKTKEFWQTLYNISGNNTNIMGCLNINHKVFQPRLYNIDKFYNVCPVDLDTGYTIKILNTFTTIDDLLQEMVFRFKSNNYVENSFMNKLQTINENGCINPIQKWTIEAMYNIIESNNNIEIID
jgi:hypothetical protein